MHLCNQHLPAAAQRNVCNQQLEARSGWLLCTNEPLPFPQCRRACVLLWAPYSIWAGTRAHSACGNVF